MNPKCVLPPLDPDGFLAWVWATNNGKGRAMTVGEWALNFDLPYPDARRMMVSQAAWERAQLRKGVLLA